MSVVSRTILPFSQKGATAMSGLCAIRRSATIAVMASSLAFGLAACNDNNNDSGGVGPSGSANLPTQAQLLAALKTAQDITNPIGGFDLNPRATVLVRSGTAR